MLVNKSKIATTFTASPQRYHHANFISAILDEEHSYHLMAGVQHITSQAEHWLPLEEFREWLVDFVVCHRMIYRVNRVFRIGRPAVEKLWIHVDKNLIVDYHAELPGQKHTNVPMVIHDCRQDFTWYS